MKKSTKYFSRVLGAFLLCTSLMFTGCYDDSALQEQLKDHESRLNELERLTAQQNTNISSLQTIVAALQEKDYVTNVSPINEDGKVIGYTITFSKSGPITIYHGTDGYVPTVGVKQDTDGQWYWTIDGDWMLDSDGAKVRASAVDGEDGAPGTPGQNGNDGVTPKLKIEEGYWCVSYDNGQNWERYAPATGEKGDKGDQGEKGEQGEKGDKGDQGGQGEKGDSMFKEVTYDSDYVYLTLSDGTMLMVPRTKSYSGENAVGPATFSIENVTATTAEFKGHIDLPKEEQAFYDVTVYFSQKEPFHLDDAIAYSYHEFDENNVFEFSLGNLTYNTEYHYCLCVEYRGQKYFSENVMSFKTSDISIEVAIDESSITYSSALLYGKITGMSDEDVETAGIEILYSSEYNEISEDMSSCECVRIDALEDGGLFCCQLSLLPTRKYYYRYRFTKWTPNSDGASRNYVCGEIKEFVVPKDPIAAEEPSANCYIVSKCGEYKFITVKGNSNEYVGDVASAEVLWESFGTDVTPAVGDLIKSVSYKYGYIVFQTADTFKEGNAVIAAKDDDGNILWSWHIWFTDQPEEQVYFNNAGTMMDRNLGATSANPGDVGALGLLYQWGRKDPFLGGCTLSSSTVASSTIVWPSPVSSDSSNGTIAYATANPTTFIKHDRNNHDWYYTGSSSTDNTRWTESSSPKSIYDPCPVGWRVPDGGENGVWSKALGSGAYFSGYPYDKTKKGMNFSGKFGSDQVIWYPTSGFYYGGEGIFYGGHYGHFSSATPKNYYACLLDITDTGWVYPSHYDDRAEGQSVRCIKVIDEVTEP